MSKGFKMKVIPVRLPDKIIAVIDRMVQEGFYANRNGAIRIIVTNYVLKERIETQ
jgi:Arc/MetJ-type ribon-helix-helix transcriptional regulator